MPVATRRRMYGIKETAGGPGGVGPGGAAAADGAGTGIEFMIGFGCRWKGSLMFKKADSAWTGTLCCA